MANNKAYKYIKLAGIVSFIPIVLVTGPLGGYFIADIIKNKFINKDYIILIGISIGCLASLIEVIRIIKLAIKIEKDING